VSMTSRVHDRIRLEECECPCLFRAVTVFVSLRIHCNLNAAWHCAWKPRKP